MKFIIVQAGGKGTRLEHLTRNKPKALLPVQNLPMIFHLFRQFPEKKFIVIGDYKIDVLKKYLAAFADVDYKIVDGAGKPGTCAGLSDALALIPENEPFMLTWCDLILPEDYALPKENADYIGVSRGFKCRWKYEGGAFAEEPSENHGVAGHFIFSDKKRIFDVPGSGEFVRYLSGKNIAFKELPLARTREFGLLSEYEKLATEKCRPFNRMTMQGDRIIKEGIDEQGKKLAVREKAWYAKVADKNFKNIPKIYALDPLTMEKIDGKNIYEYSTISSDEKKQILSQIIGCLKSVQTLESAPADRESYDDAYIGKTKARLEKVRNLVPFANDKTVTVNGRTCRNVFYHWEELEKIVASFYPSEFRLIHGDCTFSNMMLRTDGSPVLIDPRGYFGKTELYGDTAYDWAKVYYSVVGNYDQFNLKRFRLDIRERDVELKIDSNHWEDMEESFFELLGNEVSRKQIKALHAIIWLSLTTYAWHDYDSICGAFYNGLYYLEEVLG
ncbi:NTP transferase domain-containing protein [Treponema sp. UBA3813]|uniref:NTP transferase domain-containing protein n=1 Tax=Treponema sp. UBA3813 TaxID=1947715 RepID=UPI0025CCDF40|nr:NTP transferase domain-containing protein [Treponema sp. UBA3813]